jgi:hypothetical protein
MKQEQEWAVRIRIRKVRIRSRYEITLAIPDLETNGNLDPDPQKVAQHWPELDRNCGSGSTVLTLRIVLR